MRDRTSSIFIAGRLSDATGFACCPSSEDRTKRPAGKQPRPKVLDFPDGHQKEDEKSRREKARETREEIAEKTLEEIRREKSQRAEEASPGEAGREIACQARGKISCRQGGHEVYKAREQTRQA